MRLNDWKRQAEQYSEIDRDVLAKIEADEAAKYRVKYGRWPEGLSTRAWDILVNDGRAP